MLKVDILTTETLHHAYFVRELQGPYSIRVLAETSGFKAPYETRHEFEGRRDEHERRAFFGGQDRRLADFAETTLVEKVKSPEGVRWIEQGRADAVVVFGTGILKAPVIRAARGAFWNLHGGDPQRYRGLDSHLWSVFHRDRSGLVTCLHELVEELDAGPILGMKPIPLDPGMPIEQLRARNTQVCVELVQSALADLAAGSPGKGVPQTQVGRNYTAMPTCLKDLCVKYFAAMTRGEK